jgi:hypothetical protein
MSDVDGLPPEKLPALPPAQGRMIKLADESPVTGLFSFSPPECDPSPLRE